jgi:hypothetical protein
MKNDFLQGVEKIAITLIKKIRDFSTRKNSVKPIENAKQTIISVNKQLEKGFVGDAARKETITEVRAGLQGLADLQKKRNVPEVIKEKAEIASEKLNTLLDEVKEAKPSIAGALEGSLYSRKEQELIRSVLDAVFELFETSKDRKDLVERVLKKLKRNNP